MPDTSDLEQFLRAMWPEIPSGHWLVFWGTPSKRSEWVSGEAPLADTLPLLEQWATKENVYLGCATRGANLGPTLRGDRADCLAIPGLWLDIDYGSDHKKPNLPPTEDDAQTLLAALGISPSAVIHSGRGLQAWWWFKEPWIFESEEERKRAETLTKAWSTTLLARAKERGWAADAVGDLPRVMRLPGLWNRKGVPKPTRLLGLTGTRYNPGDFTDYLLAPKEPTETLPDVKWTFELSQAAEPPGDKFMLLAEIDTQFKLSWLHARKDLQDQSASTYDLALATRAFAASWAPQEVVNLLIAHRRKHGEDLKLRKDYYGRTLSKALSGKDQETRKQHIESLKAGKTPPESKERDPAENLAIVSEMLGVKIEKICRYQSDETNIYDMWINGRKVTIPNIKILDSQTEFRRLLMDHADKRIGTMKAYSWHIVVQKLLDSIENVQVDMASRLENYESYLETYLTGSSTAIRPESEWQEACGKGNPFYLKGRTWITTNGFLRHLQTNWNERVTSRQLSVILTQIGLHYEKKYISTKYVERTSRGCWRVR